MSTITDAVAALAKGKLILVVDNEDRENEGDLIMAAEHATTDSVAFFLEHTSGFLCVALDEPRAETLGLELMVRDNTDRHRTAFLVSVDYTHGTSTGISAGDRAATIRALAAPETVPTDLARPGHVLPLLAKPGGVLERPGHTEAGVDLCKLAGLSGAALLCEVVTPDRRDMMRRPELEALAAAHDIPIVSIADLRAWRAHTERAVGRLARRSKPSVTRSGQSTLPTEVGTFEAIAFGSPVDGVEHLALVMGNPASSAQAPLVRVHS
ncbi:MAG TPA: 3,4-dihydroxy-2-butanone-4-phosphate synthase, partial [Aldersonia sp.]